MIELLTTLMIRNSVQEVIKQGIVPLITTISSYMIIEGNKERHHYGDSSYFIHEKDEDFYKVRSVRNLCLDFISSLIEALGDLSVHSILYVIEHVLFSSDTRNSSEAVKTVEEVNIYEYTYTSTNPIH